MAKVMFPAWLCSRSAAFEVPEHLLSSQLRVTLLIPPFLLREILGQCHIPSTSAALPRMPDFFFPFLPLKQLVVINKNG